METKVPGLEAVFRNPRPVASVATFLVIMALASPDRGGAQTVSYTFSTMVGMAGVSGSADGTNETARFNYPAGLALDSKGTLYVSDILNHTIRKVEQVGTNWVVRTIAGLAGTPGSTDGTNSNALFNHPNGVGIDPAGNLFVADHYNHTIRELSPQGTNWVVTTIAGFAGASGALDGTNDEARFWSPTGVAVDSQGHIFVADTANFTVREIVSEGTNWVVSTIAGRALNFGFADGTNNRAQFNYPYGVAIGGAGSLYVADFGNNAIRLVVPEGTNWVVSTIAGFSGVMGTNDGPGSLATFNSPNSLCVDQTGSALFVTDQFNDTIRQLTLDGTNWMVSTVAGLALQRGSTDGLGTNAQFRLPWGIGINPEGDLYVADYGNHTIRKGLFIPSLGISISNQSAILSWSRLAAGYGAEVCTALGLSPTWLALTNSPATNGANFVLTNEPGPAAAFYRLHKR